MKRSVVLAMIILTIVSLAHLLRVIFRLEVVVGGAEVPLWMSVVGFLFAGGIAAYLWFENRKPA
ncbi:MAG TPA: hypothetical protein PK747_05980 [Acidobacteriota bacterium]|jgi:hypothetical protein|nr:hypothetical protein [Acidobacteriota bacterium]HNT17236.1 hypothetical protein [Acidobacteriota bacterium]HPA26582.1 hypothetical protein [Acidobacteriota bacterium]HQO20214.1 hypothetical protein [Acidobacteriota bacterium]HQQ46943.1 hypothetical protein [Acidobacteriota bacterium]